MALTNTEMQKLANTLRTDMLYLQLHSAAGGAGSTANQIGTRLAPTWTSPSGSGNFDLTALLDFSGLAANQPVYSVSAWSASSGGTNYGEWVLTGDSTANAAGHYQVTAFPVTGTAT